MKERKKYSKEEKLRIVQEAAEQGVKVPLDKYGLYPATFLVFGEQAPRAQLKQLLAEQQLESKLKDELLKKKYPWARGKN